MPTRAPPPQPITSDASPICTTLSDLTQNIYINSPIFRCDLKEQCEAGLSCVLDIAHTQYRVDITVEQSSVEFSVSSLDGGSSYGVSKNRNTTVALPTPDGSSLVFRQNTGSQRAVGFGVSLFLCVHCNTVCSPFRGVSFIRSFLLALHTLSMHASHTHTHAPTHTHTHSFSSKSPSSTPHRRQRSSSPTQWSHGPNPQETTPP